MTSREFRVLGLSSRHGVRLLSGSLSDVPGVRTVEVDLETDTVRVTGPADLASLHAAIRRAGFKPSGQRRPGDDAAQPARAAESAPDEA